MKDSVLWSRQARKNQNPRTSVIFCVFLFTPSSCFWWLTWMQNLSIIFMLLNFPCVICHCIWRDGYLFIYPEEKLKKKSFEEKRTKDRNQFCVLQGQFQFTQIHFKAVCSFSVGFMGVYFYCTVKRALSQSIIFNQYYHCLYFLSP